MKIALALIVKGSDNEAEALKACLARTAPDVDGVFITITQKNKRVEEVARMYNAHISHFDWIDNFAAARNYNFAQVPKEYDYILWCDADDVFRGLSLLKEAIEKNPADVYVMDYLYWFDPESHRPVVVHLKSQVIKNDGCVKWAGYLHEDFSPNRELTSYFIKDIKRVHTSTQERFNVNKERNLRISQKWLKAEPEDPRNWWNVANSYKAVGDNLKAIENFNKFMSMSRSEDEKYIARLRLAEIHFSLGEFSKALDDARYALGTKPQYPDAYHLLGHIYFKMNNLGAARDSYLMGLKKKPPIYSIIVYNPREYDYIPLMNLAKVYYSLNLPSMALECLRACQKIEPNKNTENMIKTFTVESDKFKKVIKKLQKLGKIKDKLKLKRAIDKLPKDIRSHPAVCQLRNTNFVKKESSGRDLVFYCGFTEQVWDAQIMRDEGSGGAEEALVNLVENLKDWNITVYCNCGHKEKEINGVHYKPFWMWNYRDKQDVTVVWRHVRPVDYGINSDKVYIDLHDTIPEGEFNEGRLKKIDKIMVKSNAHRDLYSNVPDNKICIIPNGIDLTLFDKHEERDPYYLVNLSSPDRMIRPMIEIFEEVLERVSEDIKKKVKLGWFYGWDLFKLVRTSDKDQEWMNKWIKRFETLKEKGNARGGHRISLKQVVEENYKAGVLFYPTGFYEIDYMGGTKAMIAGALPITTDFAALKTKMKYGVVLPADVNEENWALHRSCDFGIKSEELKEKFVDAIVKYLYDPSVYEEERKEMMLWARKEFDCKRIAKLWDQELKINILKETDNKKYVQVR